MISFTAASSSPSHTGPRPFASSASSASSASKLSADEALDEALDEVAAGDGSRPDEGGCGRAAAGACLGRNPVDRKFAGGGGGRARGFFLDEGGVEGELDLHEGVWIALVDGRPRPPNEELTVEEVEDGAVPVGGDSGSTDMRDLLLVF